MFQKGDRVLHKQRQDTPQGKKGPIKGTVDVVIDAPSGHFEGPHIVNPVVRYPSKVCVNVLWDEIVQDAKAGTARLLSHDSEELVLA